jgi:uncharacterized repeat protein (TIGR01451 family)
MRVIPILTAVLWIALAAVPASAAPVPCSQVTLTWPADEARVQITDLDAQPLSWSGCAGAYEVEVVHPDGTTLQTTTNLKEWNFREEEPTCGTVPCPQRLAGGAAVSQAIPATTDPGNEHAQDAGWYSWRVRPCDPDCANGTWREASFLASDGPAVQVENGQFVLDGQLFPFVGVNLRGIVHLGTTEMDEQLQAAYAMGARVVRVWLFRNDVDPDVARARLFTFLNRMLIAGPDMRAIVTFADFYGSGFQLAADAAAYDGGNLHPDWFIAGHGPFSYRKDDQEDDYHDEVLETVDVFAGQSRILAWELGNEFNSASNSGTAMQEFVRTMRTKIHTRSIQMVTGGFMSSYHAFAGLTGVWDPTLLYTPGPQTGDYFDFMTVHGYDLGWRNPGNGYEGYQRQDIDYLWALANGLPYVVEEMGFTGALATSECFERQVFTGGTWLEIAIPSAVVDRGPAVATTLDIFFDGLNAQGVMQWGFMVGGDNQQGDHCAGLDQVLHTDYDSVRCAYLLKAEELGVPVDGSCDPDQLADLAVSLSVSDQNPTVGEQIVYTFGVTDLGPQNATAVILETETNSTPPGGLDYAWHSVTAGSYQVSSGLWTIPVLAAGASATLQVAVDVDAAGFHITSLTRLSSLPFDPSGANDLAVVTVVSHDDDPPPPPPGTADLAVTVTASDTTPVVGDRIDYTVKATNHGPAAASGVVIDTVTDSTPAGGLSYFAHTQTAGTYTPQNGDWSIPSLGTGSTATLVITVDVVGTGTHVTTASRAASSPVDPNPGNDAASVTVVSTSTPPPPPPPPGSCPNPAGSQELVTNGGFWGWQANWHLTPPPGGTLAHVGVEDCCSLPPGGYPHAFAHLNGSGGIAGLWQDVPNARAGNYRVRARVISSSPGVQAWVQTDTGNPNQVYCSSTPAGHTAWTWIDCCFSLPAPAPLHVAITASNGASGWVNWDDVSLWGPAPAVPRRQVEASGGGAFYLDGAGTAKTWGSNSSGQYGNGTTVGSLSAVASGFSSVRDLAAGNPYTCAATFGGGVQCSGFGSNSPVPVTGFPATVVEVASAGFHHCARLSDGRVRCWGQNGSGQLGNGTTTSSSQPVPVTGLTDAVQIAVGDSYSCAVRANGRIACWGDNEHGQLGDGTTTDRTTPVLVQGLTGAVQVDADHLHTCAITSGQQAHCWGRNHRGQLGDGSTTDRHTPVGTGLTGAVQIGVGNEHSCARLVTGRVSCWGANDDGQLGNGSSNDVPVPVPVLVAGGALLAGAEDLAVGGYHACVAGHGGPGTVSCWGDDEVGQLGNGSPAADRNYAVAVSGVD